MAQGQIERRGERVFRLRWFHGRDASGKRRYGSRTIHGTKKDAQRVLREIQGRQELGSSRGASGSTATSTVGSKTRRRRSVGNARSATIARSSSGTCGPSSA
jgi:hypothetical protein